MLYLIDKINKLFIIDVFKKYLKILLIVSPLFIMVLVIFTNHYHTKDVFNTKHINLIEIKSDSKGNYSEELKRNLLILKEKDKERGFKEILDLEKRGEPFVNVNSNIISLGFIPNSVWFKFSLINKTTKQTNLTLLSSYPLIDYIECYMVSNQNLNVKIFRKGDRIEYKDSTNLFERISFFKIEILPEEKLDIYLRIKTESTLIAILFLFSEDNFIKVNRIIGIIQGSYFIILLFLIFMQSFLFFFMKDSIILYYIFYHLAFLFFMFFSSDLPIQFFPNWHKFSNEATLLSIALMYFFIIGLSIRLLNLLPYYKTLNKFMKLIFYLLIFNFIFVFLSSFMTTNDFFYKFRGFNFLFTNTIIFFFIFFIFKQEIDVLIVYFYSAWLWGICGIILATLVNLGIIKEIIPFLPYLYIFSFIEFIVITFGIFHKYKITYQREKEVSIALQNELRKKNLYQKNLNKKLVFKITKNNKKLSIVNRKLKHTIENLRKHQEQLIQSEKMMTVGLMTSAISHEIKNPLNFIKSYNNLIENIIDKLKLISLETQIYEQNINSEIEYSVANLKVISEKINYGVDRISMIINQLKRFMTSEEEDNEEFDIIYCIESALLSLPYKFLENIDIKRKYYDMFTIKGNKGLMKQVFVNLFLNSIQSMKHQGAIEVQIYKSGNDGKIILCDTGEGIPKGIQNKIFEPFFTTKSGIGTGLGLSIVQIIVSRHQGTIRLLESKKGKTCFEIVLKIS